jgi:hypothetical protein
VVLGKFITTESPRTRRGSPRKISVRPLPNNGEAMLKLFYLVSCALCFVNGAWMLFFPLSWYRYLPADVPHTGPFNPHFVRDLGVVYLVVALAFGWSARNIDRSRPVHLALTVFFAGHALIHLADIVAGRLPDNHWLIDTPGVFAPALIMIVLALPSVRRRLGGT